LHVTRHLGLGCRLQLLVASTRSHARRTGQTRDRTLHVFIGSKTRLRLGPAFGRSGFRPALVRPTLFGTPFVAIPVAAPRLIPIRIAALLTAVLPLIVAALIAPLLRPGPVATALAVRIPSLIRALIRALVLALVGTLAVRLLAARIRFVLIIPVAVIVSVIVVRVETGAVLFVIIAGTTNGLPLPIPIITEEAIIMLGILQIIFCRHPVSSLLRIARKTPIFFQ
jgi:hypothetical protein